MLTEVKKQRSYKGTVLRTKIIKALDPTLVYLKLALNEDNNKIIKALVAKNALTFLMDVQEGDTITIYGHYNHRKQFIVDKYLSAFRERHRQLKDTPSHLSYPPKKD